MRRTPLLLLAAASLALVTAGRPGAAFWAAGPPAPPRLAGAEASLRPAHGGVLRMQMRARVVSLDPALWPGPSGGQRAAAADRLAELALETLVRYDAAGRPPAAAGLLATGWQHDPEFRHWQFRLRDDVKFHDGTQLTASMAAAALDSGAARDWRVSVFGETLVIEAAQPMPDLLSQLALPRHAIAVRARDGSLAGTGPFRIAAWTPEQRARFEAFDEHWAGRPFLDAVEVEMGRPLRQQWTEFELGRADLVELAPGGPEASGRAAEAGRRVWSSAPVELVALVFNDRGPAAAPALREAVARAMDRGALHEVLLGGAGQPAGAMLPQWLSGFAFLFPPAERDMDRARELVAALPRTPRRAGQARPPATPPLALVYDAADPMAQALAERIAVDAREAGLSLQPAGRDLAPGAAGADVQLLRWRLTAAEPVRALADLGAALGEPVPVADLTSPEAIYAAERALLDSFRVVPLLHLTESFALSPRLRNWAPPAHGRGLRLAGLWLAGDAAAAVGEVGREARREEQ
jgi:peptide/nickel transport system substrate-binding protein